MRGLLSASQAAKVMQCSTQMVRERMKRGMWDIGMVVPPQNKNGNHTYEIVPSKLAELLGISVEEVERRLGH